MRQTTIDENSPAKKELREHSCVAIARWLCDVGIAFNAVNYDSFGEMIRAIGNYGKEMKTPSFHEVRVRLLNKEVQIINDLLESHKEEWGNYGWRILEANFSHIYWTQCAAHCIDLMLEDIFKIRKFTNGVELLRPGQTRFATAFITLGRIHLQKANIRKMFTSKSWTTSKWAKAVKGKKCERMVLSSAFWNHVVYALKVSGPLICVLRLVDNEKKLAMGYIFEAMDRAKEAIANSLNGNEEKYKSIFEIIDVNTGLLSCIHKMEKNSAKVDMILDEIEKYKAVAGTFGFPSAIRGRTTKSP
ncbi:hypothetical protein P3X46_000609, partial [Hevea brasiliensis]